MADSKMKEKLDINMIMPGGTNTSILGPGKKWIMDAAGTPPYKVVRSSLRDLGQYTKTYGSFYH